MRHFKEVTCPSFNTVETDREYNARCRAAAAVEKKRSRQCTNVTNTTQSTSVGGKRPKTFNLLTSKLHALGDYVNMIKMFGTTDSYSTQIVSYRYSFWSDKLPIMSWLWQGELEHRNVKRRYAQTNKQKYIDQMVNREVLERVHERMNDEMTAAEGYFAGATPSVDPRAEDFVSAEHASGSWCRIAQDQSKKVYLPHFISEPQNAIDPAFKVSTDAHSYPEFPMLTGNWSLH
jgi:hypothetical protein